MKVYQLNIFFHTQYHQLASSFIFLTTLLLFLLFHVLKGETFLCVQLLTFIHGKSGQRSEIVVRGWNFLLRAIIQRLQAIPSCTVLFKAKQNGWKTQHICGREWKNFLLIPILKSFPPGSP